MASVRFLGKAIASALLLALLVGLMLHFRLAAYPYLASAFAGSFVIYWFSRPGARGVAIAVLAGALYAMVYGFFGTGSVTNSFAAFLGLGSLASIGLTALWCSGADRRRSLDVSLPAALFPLFLIVAGFSLAMTEIAHPRTYDLFLYACDARLGLQPSFLAGRLLARCGPLRQVCLWGYEGLPFAMAIAFAFERAKAIRPRASLLLAFLVAAAGGFILYHIYPAVGPVHVFGADFPNTPPQATRAPYQMLAAGPAPRNAMPSVHLAMALLIWWNARRGPRWWRFAAAALVAVTILATLGFGEHYLADLCVAAPFALLAQAVSTVGLPWRNAVRAGCAACGGGCVLAWLAYLRLPAPPCGHAMWVLLFSTVAAALAAESRLNCTGRAARRQVNEGEYTEGLAAPG